MTSTQALVCRHDAKRQTQQNYLSLESITLPAPKQHQILVRNKALAQNPTDVLALDTNAYGEGAVIGCDFCGRVEQLGADVSRFQVGDRIASFVWGGSGAFDHRGAYATHTLADEQVCFQVPEAMSSEAAATLPLALTTAWLALLSNHSLGIDRQKGDEVQLLVWGGTSSVGQYALQLARHFGFQVATTCTNREIVDKLGVKLVFDYKSPTVVEDIKRALPKITYVFDCIGSEASSTQASQTVCEDGGVLCTVRPGKVFCDKIESRVRSTDVIVWSAFFIPIKYRGLDIPPRQDDRDLAVELYEQLPDLLRKGSIKPNAVRVVAGGLKAVAEGFQLHRDKAISGQKLVYNLE